MIQFYLISVGAQVLWQIEEVSDHKGFDSQSTFFYS